MLKHSTANDRGYTLTELIVAASLMLVVVSVSGSGLIHVLSVSQKNLDSGDRRIELQRALDFIATEVRQVSDIKVTPSSQTPEVSDEFRTSPSFPSAEIDPDSVQPILMLDILDDEGNSVPYPVTYYLATPRVSRQPWAGPKVLYRWGPKPLFDFSKQKWDRPEDLDTWSHQLLVDNLNGFDTQVDPGTKRMARLEIKGQLDQGSSLNSSYTLNTRVFVRSK